MNCVQKMRLFTLVGAAVVLISASGATALAEDTNASPTPTPAPAVSPAPTTAASPTPAAAQTPSVEDRLASLEAYINNTDGTKASLESPVQGTTAG